MLDLSAFRRNVVACCEAEAERWRTDDADPTHDPWRSISGYWLQGLGVKRRDGATGGLADFLFDQLEAKVASSRHFKLARRKGEGWGQIVVTSRFDDAGYRTHRFHVNFMRNFPEAPILVGSSTGACHEEDMARCAEIVIRDAVGKSSQ